jgi:hypothetical protein
MPPATVEILKQHVPISCGIHVHFPFLCGETPPLAQRSHLPPATVEILKLHVPISCGIRVHFSGFCAGKR